MILIITGALLLSTYKIRSNSIYDSKLRDFFFCQNISSQHTRTQKLKTKFNSVFISFFYFLLGANAC